MSDLQTANARLIAAAPALLEAAEAMVSACEVDDDATIPLDVAEAALSLRAAIAQAKGEA